MQKAQAAAEFPPGLVNAFYFAVFNAFSFQMVLGSPMVLYAKSLGASATVLGIIAGMMPLLVIFQIPAANHVQRVGYKRFVYGGWGIRVLFIVGMAAVPWTGLFLNPTSQLALMLMLLFGFNLSRGISSCAWLPWITSLVPESLRGKYLISDASCVNIASSLTFLLAALVLGTHPQAWQFSVLFAFSAGMGGASLIFLKRIPEGAGAAEIRTSTTPVPWQAILKFEPFRKLLRMNFAWSIAYGGLTVFVVAFLKAEARFTEQAVLVITAMSFVGGLGSLWFAGSRLDHLGSKPVLTFAFSLWLLILIGWVLVAGQVFAAGVTLMVVLQVLMGLATSMVTTANLRLAMATIPAMGRNHFFALFSVVGNLTQGIAPVLWGMMIDALGGLHGRTALFQWNRFSIFFSCVALVFVATIWLCHRLDEPRASTMDALIRDLFRSQVRFWLRLWPRS